MSNSRRDFLKKTGLITAASFIPFQPAFAWTDWNRLIGIQLFSLPKMLSEDFVGTLDMLTEMGYKEVELFGPYSFSSKNARDGWKQAATMLGFSGSGFFGHSTREIKNILNAKGFSAPAMHTDLETLTDHIEELAEAANIIGSKYVVLPAIPEDKRQDLDDYKRMAETFNSIGEAAQRNGVKFAYHNHGYGFQPVEGKVPVEMIYEQTDPELVFFELDLFWTTAAGVDPAALLDRYPNRFRMLHIKDMKEKKQFSGDGGSSSEWFALFPNMTSVGEGVLDIKGIIRKAENIGVQHFFVELDLVDKPEIALKKSHDFLKKNI